MLLRGACASDGGDAGHLTCSANCYRAQIDQKLFVHLLQAQGGSALADAAKAEIANLVPDPTAADQLGSQLDAILGDANLTGLDRFVCNDSTATLEYLTRGTISAFPLLRAKALDSQPDVGDGLDDVMRALPKDGDGLADPADALARAVAMQPFPDGSPLMWDSVLGAQIATARRDTGK